MENIQWILSGIGTELICTIVGAALGGIAGYKYGVKKNNIKQIQDANDQAVQFQVGIIEKDNGK